MRNETSEPSTASPCPSNGVPSPAQLALRHILIDTYQENVAYMHRDCEVYRAEGFKALSKIAVKANGKSILATLNVVEDASIVACGELGLSMDACAQR